MAATNVLIPRISEVSNLLRISKNWYSIVEATVAFISDCIKHMFTLSDGMGFG